MSIPCECEKIVALPASKSSHCIAFLEFHPNKVMKIHSKRQQSGFTLIELLVVISIIAVLAAAGFGAGTFAINRAKKVKALASATAIEQAVNAFYSEYGSLPFTGDPPATTNTATDTEFLTILLGKETGNSPVNTRGINFLTVKEGKSRGAAGGIDGLVYSGNALRGLFDPWGNGFTAVLDSDYDDKIVVDLPVGDDVPLSGRRVAVFAPGVPPGESITASSIVKTW